MRNGLKYLLPVFLFGLGAGILLSLFSDSSPVFSNPPSPERMNFGVPNKQAGFPKPDSAGYGSDAYRMELAEWAQNSAFPVFAVQKDAKPTPVDNGSGFLLKNGYIITNLHVAGNALKIGQNGHVAIDSDWRLFMVHVGKTYPLRYIGGYYDPTHNLDIAVLQLKQGNPGVNPLTVSPHYPRLGQEIMLSGAPMSNDGMVAFSHIRMFKSSVMVYDADAVTGFSGAPVMNMQGDVIGLHTWVETFEYTQNGWDVGIVFQNLLPMIDAAITRQETVLFGTPSDKLPTGSRGKPLMHYIDMRLNLR